tara:strand:+ start:158 stop:1090 length:933 start_codon:yes stop_codon:yes gene_type:complete
MVEISSVDPLELLGTNDQHIKLIEDFYKTKIFVRGNNLSIDGDENEVEAVYKVISDMIVTINDKGTITKNDVELLIRLGHSDSEISKMTDGDSDIILHTHKGTISAKTPGQIEYLNAVRGNDIVFGVGPAGTGKTYQAVALAVDSLKRGEVQKIVITRPAVEAGERLGFLPGDLKEKIDPYLTPLYDALNDMINKDKLTTYLNQKIIEIAPLAYMRGRTLNSSFLILDEAQNATSMQMKMFLTRLGITSKAIVTGDTTQIDLPKAEPSGLIDAIKILKNVDGISFVQFSQEDVMRHHLVKKIIEAYTSND